MAEEEEKGESKKPDYVVVSFIKKDLPVQLGFAWQTDRSIVIRLLALPLTHELVLIKPRKQQEGQAEFPG